MANEEASGAKLIGACSFNGSTIAVVKAFSFVELVEFLTIRAQAALGPTARNIYRKDLHANCRLVGGVAPAPDDATHSLVFTIYKMDGTTLVTFTLATMKVGTIGYDVNDESPPGEASAEFLHMGSLSSRAVTII